MRSGIPVCFLLIAAAARAADPTPVPTDSIAAAKADLAAIRSPLAQPDSSVALPSFDMKDVAPVAGAQLPDMPELLSKDSEIGPDGLKRKKEGTGNWLVDAMDKKTDRPATARGREKDDILKGDLDLMRDEHTGAKLGKDGLPVEEEREKASEPAQPAYNPLDSFMNGWVSAKDHDLLLPATKPDGLSGETARVHTDALQSLELGPSASQTDSALPGVDVAALSDAKPAANPYLVDLDLGPARPSQGVSRPPESPLFAPVEPVDLPRGTATSGVDARPIDGPRSVVPDFAQPSDDDKYFKQLKKF